MAPDRETEGDSWVGAGGPMICSMSAEIRARGTFFLFRFIYGSLEYPLQAPVAVSVAHTRLLTYLLVYCVTD